MSRSSEAPRTLAVSGQGLGELLAALPALRGLRGLRSRDRLVLVAPPALEPVALLSGVVDGVLPVRADDSIPGWPPALAVNLADSGASTGRLRAVEPARLWAYDEAGSPGWRADDDRVERWCRLVDAHGGDCDRTALELAVPAETPLAGGLTLVHPGGPSGQARWPASRWARVAEALADSGHDVVLVGSVRDDDLCLSIAAGAGLSNEAVLVGRLDLTALCAVVACARLVLAGDHGLAALAAAYRTRAVVLAGPAAVGRISPDRPAQAVLRPAPGEDLRSVTVDDVLGAARARV